MPVDGNIPTFDQIYLYDPADLQERIRIRYNHMQLPSSVPTAERKALQNVVQFLDERLPV